jgi:ribosomal protein S18 acetylase RimI-like enzyme
MSHATEDILIRPAQEDDIAELTRLGMGIQKLHAHGRPDIFREPDLEALKAFFEARIADDSHILIADTPKGAVGYVLAGYMVREANPFKCASSVFYIHHIAVQPSHQEAGVGRRLMDSASDLAGRLGAATLRLDSWHFNVDAHRFFEAQGFAPVNLIFERQLS